MIADDGNLCRRHDGVAGDLLIGKLHAQGGLLQHQDARPPLHQVERVFRIDRPVNVLLVAVEHGGRRMRRRSGFGHGAPQQRQPDLCRPECAAACGSVLFVLACRHTHWASGLWLWCDRLLPADLAVESDLLNQRSRQRLGIGATIERTAILREGGPSDALRRKHAENRECHDCGTRRVPAAATP